MMTKHNRTSWLESWNSKGTLVENVKKKKKKP